MILIAGLGNPGLKYRNTRHNAGFAAIDALADSLGVRFSKKRFQGVVAEARIGQKKVLLLKPHTYMNLSGKAIREAMDFYKVDPKDLIVIYDDIDLDIGRLRIKASGSAGSHNGMRSIIKEIGSTDFPRVRVGIGKPPAYMDLADFVLQKLTRQRKDSFLKCADAAAKAVQALVKSGVAQAQQDFNGLEV
ncbi:MAG: aminoacyl-tRNA hydrolase [Christensenellaceae bacterium]|nr:aminoacyl-tRNA hydrolase [Christensenellaceae bacterium]